MNPIDQAFVAAYHRQRPAAAPAGEQPVEHRRAVGEELGRPPVRIHPATAPGIPLGPHFVMPPTPSIGAPVEGVSSIPRIIQPQSGAGGDTAARAIPSPARQTLTSYLQQARKPQVAASSPSLPPVATDLSPRSDDVAELPFVAGHANPAGTRLSAADPFPSASAKDLPGGNAALGNPKRFRLDPGQSSAPDAWRPESHTPWSSLAVERGIKATADSTSVAARSVNAPVHAPRPLAPTGGDPAHRLATSHSLPENDWATLRVDQPTSKLPEVEHPARGSAMNSPVSRSAQPTTVPLGLGGAPPNRPLALEGVPLPASFTDAGPSQASESKPAPIQPLWEVDQFSWPATVHMLLDAHVDSFAEIADHFRQIQKQGMRSVALTSGERGVGRSTIAMCLAKSIADSGLRVALIDGDYEFPSLLDQLNLEVEHGWQHCIQQGIPLDEIIVQSLEDRVALVPLTESMASATVLANAASINRLLGRLAEAYDLVIIDGNRLSHKNPRLIGTGDQAMLDAALVIVDAELSLRQRVDNAVELLRQQGIQAIGMAENFHSEARA
jgi:Mrp family chromosome partitioning ATPase